jgi:hypothetical protein
MVTQSYGQRTHWPSQTMFSAAYGRPSHGQPSPAQILTTTWPIQPMSITFHVHPSPWSRQPIAGPADWQPSPWLKSTWQRQKVASLAHAQSSPLPARTWLAQPKALPTHSSCGPWPHGLWQDWVTTSPTAQSWDTRPWTAQPWLYQSMLKYAHSRHNPLPFQPSSITAHPWPDQPVQGQSIPSTAQLMTRPALSKLAPRAAHHMAKPNLCQHSQW